MHERLASSIGERRRIFGSCHARLPSPGQRSLLGPFWRSSGRRRVPALLLGRQLHTVLQPAELSSLLRELASQRNTGNGGAPLLRDYRDHAGADADCRNDLRPQDHPDSINHVNLEASFEIARGSLSC